MSQPLAETTLNSWQTPECPFSIEYAPAVMEEIRHAAVDAFFSLPHGGAEIGGVLFGSTNPAGVRIHAFRPIECEHARGPRFLLSSKDLERLAVQLEKSAGDPLLRGMQVVGWFHTHTRNGIFLCAQDLAIYNRFFAAPRHIALVVRPDGMKPTRAGFFFRDGSAVHCESSYREFVLDTPSFAPARKEKPVPAPAPAAPAAYRVAPQRIAAPVPVAVPPAPTFPWYRRRVAIAAGFGGLIFAAALTSVESALAARAVASPPAVIQRPLAAPQPAPPKLSPPAIEENVETAPPEPEAPHVPRTPVKRWSGFERVAPHAESPALPQEPPPVLIASAEPAGAWGAPPPAAGPRRVVFEGGIVTFFAESILIADRKHPRGISLAAHGVDYACESKTRSCTISSGGTRVHVKHAADYRMLMDYLNRIR